MSIWLDNRTTTHAGRLVGANVWLSRGVCRLVMNCSKGGYVSAPGKLFLIFPQLPHFSALFVPVLGKDCCLKKDFF